MSQHDSSILREKLGISSVIDLRNPGESQQQQETAILKKIDAKYYNVPFRPSSVFSFQEDKKLYHTFSNMGEVYLYRIRHREFGQQVIEALQIIAQPDNHPLIFHCGAGKDRTGILAAILLSVLGISENDIIEDFTLTSLYMNEIRKRLSNDPEISDDIRDLPEFTWEATPESMVLFLNTLKQEYGSAEGYLLDHGIESSLIQRLNQALLTS
jgi:protein-tyrosine phosphatase